MFIVFNKHRYQIYSLVYKLCKNHLKIIKYLSLSVILWHGVTHLEKSKNKHHLHHHKKEEKVNPQLNSKNLQNKKMNKAHKIKFR